MRSLAPVHEEKRRRLAEWLKGSGIEVGALHCPLWVPPYTHVRYVDRLSVEDQRKHYPELGHFPLAPVDVIATAEDLSPIDDGSVDFVIANHLIEHAEEPVRALREFDRVLRPGGVVYLAVPDKRLSFDRDRELTTVDHLLREHDDGPDSTRREHYLDWATNVMKANPGDEETTADHLMSEEYSIHFHCWDPDSFLDFFVATRQKVGLDFTVAAFVPPQGPDDAEFILILVKGRSGEPPYPPTPSRVLRWRQKLAATRLGPPVRAALRVYRSRSSAESRRGGSSAGVDPQ